MSGAAHILGFYHGSRANDGILRWWSSKRQRVHEDSQHIFRTRKFHVNAKAVITRIHYLIYLVNSDEMELMYLLLLLNDVKCGDCELNVDVGVQISRNLAKLYSTMIFEHGYIHCDPHPGNVLVKKTPRGLQIVLLDHGLYQVLDFIDYFCN